MLCKIQHETYLYEGRKDAQSFFPLKLKAVHRVTRDLLTDVDPNWSYADPDPQNLVNADPGQFRTIF